MKPILFSTDMVQAILDGRKTMTRRPIKPQPIGQDLFGVCTDSTSPQNIGQYCFGIGNVVQSYLKPQYQVGNILYVRETWLKYKEKYYYKADDKHKDLDALLGGKSFFKWHPSIHMPKEAARIFLRVTDVQVERVQDITEEDARAEGIDPYDDACYENNGWSPTFYDPDSGGSPIFRDGFIALWESLYVAKGYGWDVNPWVWKYVFERCEKEGD